MQSQFNAALVNVLLLGLIKKTAKVSLFGSKVCSWDLSILPRMSIAFTVPPVVFVDAMVQANVKPSNNWFFGGDFNEVPGDSLMAEVVEALNGSLSTLGKPTRFEGRREIDWFCSNCPQLVSPVFSPELAISDHRILGVTIETPSLRPFRGVLPKGPNFNCPDDCTIDDWRDRLQVCWVCAKQHF